jgi:hypothetical protein
MYKVTIEYTDRDHPYSYDTEQHVFVENVADAEKLCQDWSWRRERYRITKIEKNFNLSIDEII